MINPRLEIMILKILNENGEETISSLSKKLAAYYKFIYPNTRKDPLILKEIKRFPEIEIRKHIKFLINKGLIKKETRDFKIFPNKENYNIKANFYSLTIEGKRYLEKIS